MLAKGVLGNYPFYSFERGKWLIECMKVNVDKDWRKEMQGLIIFIDDNPVFSYRFKSWFKRNYIPVQDLIIMDEWINELPKLRDEVVNESRRNQVNVNTKALNILGNVE